MYVRYTWGQFRMLIWSWLVEQELDTHIRKQYVLLILTTVPRDVGKPRQKGRTLIFLRRCTRSSAWMKRSLSTIINNFVTFSAFAVFFSRSPAPRFLLSFFSRFVSTPFLFKSQLQNLLRWFRLGGHEAWLLMLRSFKKNAPSFSSCYYYLIRSLHLLVSIPSLLHIPTLFFLPPTRPHF